MTPQAYNIAHKTLKSVSFGGGVNSTALCIGLVERGERPDWILFGDTGNEFEDTYTHIELFSAWLVLQGFPPVTVIHRSYWRHSTLEDECHNLKTLPSKAFGYSGCSVKWKRQPQDKFLREQLLVQAAWASGQLVERLIGIDYDEQHRSSDLDGEGKWLYRRPLVDWKWGRAECVRVIERHGIAVPRKSACFFCPSSKKHEVLHLYRTRPDLFARAVAIEDQAEGLKTVKGLGRNWSWRQLVEMDAESQIEAPDVSDIPCACFDGGTV